MIAAVLLQLTIGAALVTAADAVTLEVRPLLGGRFVDGGWLALELRLANDGPPRSGRLAVNGEGGTIYRPVELPAGSRKQVAVHVRPVGFSRQVEARFEDEGGRVLATGSAEVQTLPSGIASLLLVGDEGGRLRAQLAGNHQARDVEPISVLPRDLPAREEPLRGMGTIVWAADSTGLSAGQRRGIERWVASGGHLVIIGGAEWQARTAAFSRVLPLGPLAATDGVSAADLATLVTAEQPDEASLGPLTVASGELRDTAIAIARLDDGRPLLAAISLGAGRVTYLAADLGAAPLSSWSEAPALWTRLIGGSRWQDELAGLPLEREQTSSMAHALSQLPALAVPPAELLLAVIVGYIMLIGPISYAALRRIDRRELAWVTAPLLVVLFSAGTYGIGSAMKGSSVILNEISVVRASVGGSSASVQTYAGVFSPSRATYGVTVHGDALLTRIDTSQFGAQARASHTTEQGDPARLHGLRVNVFGLEAIRADTTIEYSPWLQVDWRIRAGQIEGSVVNDGPEPMEDVAVVGAGIGAMLGELGPGERIEFTLGARASDGGSAADTIYRFVSFDPRNDEQRKTLARRSVLDSLTGNLSWPGASGAGLDRGPYVIGWRSQPGPVAVGIDGDRLQHFAQTVEVVSGRPELGPGEVRLEPAQLSVSLMATDGEAIERAPGYVSVGNGSATFRIGLPLEAAGLLPERLSLLVGSDPSMIVHDQRGFGGRFPQGYEVSAWNRTTEDWELIGDASQRSRFKVTDPGAFIDGSGQILVRFSGNQVPAQFGHADVFVGASVEGWIER